MRTQTQSTQVSSYSKNFSHYLDVNVQTQEDPVALLNLSFAGM